MFGLTFANPALIMGGAAMIASPIIIHIINRLRFRRVRFAAMEFLLESEQKNRRRILLEQLLLLLLRILIVLAIAFLIARWIMGANQLAMLAGVKSHHVVLIDDSGSTRQTWEAAADGDEPGGVTTAFDQAKRVVETLAAESEREEGTRQLTVLLLSRLDAPLYERADIDRSLLTDIKTKLKNLQPTHRTLQLADGLEAARKLLQAEKSGIRHLHVVSDYRRSDWTETTGVSDSIAALAASKVSVNLVKTVPLVEEDADLAENLGIVNIEGDVHIAAAKVPLEIVVSVHNYGEERSDAVKLTILSDGVPLPGNFDVGRIDPGKTEQRRVYIPFNTPGKHRLEVRLPEDVYEPDNSRHVAIDVSGGHRVLIVDGDTERVGSYYLETALAPEGLPTGYEPLVQTTEYLRRNPLDEFAAIYIVNVPSLEPDAVKPLREYVANGGGLAWFVGNQVNADFYNTSLYGARQFGTSPTLFPIPLEAGRRTLRRDALSADGPDVELTRHPMFERLFDGDDTPFTGFLEVEQYSAPDRNFRFVDSEGEPAEDGDGNPRTWIEADDERNDGVRTIARLRNGEPLVLEHEYGAGRVVTLLTTADPTWNNWAKEPGAWVPIVLELQRRLARTSHVPEARVVGEPIHFDLDGAAYQAEGRYQTPDEELGAQKLMLNYEEDADAGSARLIYTFGETGETDEPGLYRFDLPLAGATDEGTAVEQRWFAFNVPESESEMQLATTDELRTRLGADVEVAIHEPGKLEYLEGQESGSDVRRGLLLALILFLLCEQLLAWRLSFHPETAGAPR